MRGLFHHRGKTSELSSEAWLQTTISYNFSGVIFDCDGTLVESSKAHFRCMQAAAADQGYDLSLPWYQSRTGLDRATLFRVFAENLNGKFDIARACRVSIDAYAGFSEYVEPIPPSIALLLDLQSRLPVAVATNAERNIAEISLSKVKIAGKVDTLVSISDGVLPKPAPDLFLLAAERLSIDAEGSLVVEDSPQGVAAALAAGMSVIHLQHGCK